MERLLVETIAKENDFTVITKLDDKTREYLKEHIQKSILERYDYKPLEHIQKMIDLVVDDYEYNYGLNVINYIKSIKYAINDKFYEKLQEPFIDSDDLDFEDYDNDFDIPLNEYTLMDSIVFDIIDGIDLMVDEFDKDNFWEKSPYYELYQSTIRENLELYFKHKNRERKETKNINEVISNIFNQEPLNYENIKLKKDLEHLTKRETTLIKAHTILIISNALKLIRKNEIGNDYNINSNTPQANQDILDNSYDVIIDELKKFQNTNQIITLIENEKAIHNDLFTNGKKLSKLEANNHYMSFLYKCNSVYTDYEKIVFQEFVEALISGYIQYLEFEDRKNKIKSYNHDLEVLKRYNNSKENDKNIKEIEDGISLLSIAKPHQKFIPFKELSNRLEIDINEISNYITSILNNGTHKNTIKQHFDTLQTMTKEICISKF